MEYHDSPAEAAVKISVREGSCVSRRFRMAQLTQTQFLLRLVKTMGKP